MRPEHDPNMLETALRLHAQLMEEVAEQRDREDAVWIGLDLLEHPVRET